MMIAMVMISVAVALIGVGGTISGTLEGIIQSTTFESGNTFTTGFIDELKTALGIS